ncbi:MAG: signal recognition particle receptor subunit alpha [Candidatus Altiarchaeota archaeon]|nr:signal recognition particle receptor subunit alpha [Candidatus Altiarchaeota archaeon]
MAFEKLSLGLQNAITSLKKAVVVDKKTVKEYIKEIQKVLLAADVNVKLVFELSKRIEERGLLEKPSGMLSKKENLIKITYEELSKLLGAGEKLGTRDGDILLLVGTQGSGKTTTVAKLGKYFKKKGLHPKVICADTFRPAAYDQLKQLAEEIQVPFYGDNEVKNSLDIIKKGIEKFKREGVIIIDSEGRHKLDSELMREINKVYTEIKPDKTLLVLDGATGQGAGDQAEAFRESCSVDGVILTKMDGSAKGGGALSACAATSSMVYFMGVGEHIDDFEEFDAERFVSKLIGFGDLQGLLEKAKEVEFDEESAKRLMSGKFTLEDVYSQIEQMNQLGPMKKVMEMLPFGSKVPQEMLQLQEEKLKGFKIAMDSMTKEELQNPELIKRPRIERIAKGSGVKTEDVRELMSYYRKMKKMMKSMGSERKLRRMMEKFGMGVGG